MEESQGRMATASDVANTLYKALADSSLNDEEIAVAIWRGLARYYGSDSMIGCLCSLIELLYREAKR